MPRRGENIYKRKDGRWEGRYIRGRTPAGKAEYGYVYAKSYAVCREKRRKMEGIIPQKPTLTGEMSVAQAVAFFLSDRRGELKASTVGRYEYVTSHYIVPDLGTVMLHELTAEKLSAYFKRLQNRGLSSKTVRDIGVLLKTVFKVVKKKCHCDCPGRDAELPAYRGKETEVFGDHEIATLAQKVLETPDITGLCVLLVLNTGLRLGEICALRKSDIDYRSGFLRIERSAARVRDASGTHLVVQSPKSSSSVRLVAIPDDMAITPIPMRTGTGMPSVAGGRSSSLSRKPRSGSQANALGMMKIPSAKRRKAMSGPAVPGKKISRGSL